MDYIMEWVFLTCGLVLAGTVVYQSVRLKELRDTNRELYRICRTEFRVTRDDHEIVAHTFIQLYNLAKEQGGMTTGANKWEELDTAYGTMKIGIRTQDRRK